VHQYNLKKTLKGIYAVQPEDGELTIEDKAAGMGSVFKRDDTRLAAMREQDEREKVP